MGLNFGHLVLSFPHNSFFKHAPLIPKKFWHYVEVSVTSLHHYLLSLCIYAAWSQHVCNMLYVYKYEYTLKKFFFKYFTAWYSFAQLWCIWHCSRTVLHENFKRKFTWLQQKDQIAVLGNFGVAFVISKISYFILISTISCLYCVFVSLFCCYCWCCCLEELYLF